MTHAHPLNAPAVSSICCFALGLVLLAFVPGFPAARYAVLLWPLGAFLGAAGLFHPRKSLALAGLLLNGGLTLAILAALAALAFVLQGG